MATSIKPSWGRISLPFIPFGKKISLVLYLYWFLSCLAMALFYVAIIFLRRHKNKVPLFTHEDIKPQAINLSSMALFSFLFCFIFFFAIGGYTGFNISLFFLAIDAIVLIINPYKLIKEAKTKLRINKKHIIFSSILVGLLVLEAFAFNYKTYSRNGDVTDVSLTSLNDNLVSKSAGVSFTDEGLTLDTTNSYGGDQDASFVISNLPDNFKNARFTFAGDTPSTEITIRVYSQYEDSGTFYYQGSYLTDGINANFNIIGINNGASLSKVRFTFSYDSSRMDAPETITITKLELDSPVFFVFSPIRLLALGALAAFIVYCPDISRKLKYSESTNKPYYIIGGLTIVAVIAFSIYAFTHSGSYFTKYPISEAALQSASTDIYTALFDALNKGQVYLDIVPDPKLLTVSNPWSSDVWNEYGISVLWDHAYYNGHYYSYYGILPVLLVSFPFYWLSGCTLVPNVIFLQLFAVILLVPALMVLLLELNRLITKRVCWPLLIFLMGVSVFTAMSFSNVTFKDGYYHEGIYHTPIAYGLLSMCLFLIFAIRAYHEDNHKGLNLFLSALFFVFIIASRPNLAISVVFVAPLYIALLVKKGVGWKKKVLEFTPLVLTLVTGAVLICSYNYARFNSIMEFGQTYQMNYDQTHLTYEWNKILPTFVHFYLQGPAFYDHFPFLSCSTVNLSFDNSLYIRSYLGAAWVPFFWMGLPLPFLFKKKDGWPVMASAIILPILIFFFAFTTYSLAGLCPRYLIEFYFFCTLAAFISIIKFFDMNMGKENMTRIVPVVFTLSILGLIVTLGLQFDSFDGFISGDLNGWLLTLREAFCNFNV